MVHSLLDWIIDRSNKACREGQIGFKEYRQNPAESNVFTSEIVLDRKYLELEHSVEDADQSTLIIFRRNLLFLLL